MTETTNPTAWTDFLKELLTDHPVLAQLAGELLPYAPAFARMVEAERADIAENLLQKDWYAAERLIVKKMTEAEMKAVTDETRARIIALLNKTAADEKLLREVAVRLVIFAVTTGVPLIL